MYVFCLPRGMCYVLLWTYALCYAISHLPTWWTNGAMCYKGFNCNGTVSEEIKLLVVLLQTHMPAAWVWVVLEPGYRSQPAGTIAS